MTEQVTLHLPKLGESIHSAKVVNWLKRVGERVELDEAIVEVSTDKVNSEIPSPLSGILTEILASVDSDVEVGAPLAIIQVASAAHAPVEGPKSERRAPPCPLAQTAAAPSEGTERQLSPAVLRLAEVSGVSLQELLKLAGTGEGGRVTKRDLENYLAKKSVAAPKVEKSASATSESGEERIQLTGMRKAIAENMVRSFYEAPHASVVMEADVTEAMALIAREKQAFYETHGAKLTITSFIIQALAKAVALYPFINASLEGETIITKRYVNVGLAVHVDGGLLVPVLRHCQDRNLVSLAKAVADLSSRAREKKLSPDEVKEGTITLTNFGMTGALIGVPIIRYPEVAIVGVGSMQKRLVIREDDSIAIRQMLYLTLTFDHRIIDGIYGCEFLSLLKRNLESVALQ